MSTLQENCSRLLLLALAPSLAQCGGQTGSMDPDPPPHPWEELPAQEQPVEVACARFSFCLRTEKGKVTCYGPETLEVDEELYSDIDVYLTHGCGLTIDGDARCWGDGEPDGLEFDPDRWEGAPPGPFGYIVAGEQGRRAHGCAGGETRGPECWGDSVYHPAGSDELFVELDVADRYLCGVLVDDGTARCWPGLSGGEFPDSVAGPWQSPPSDLPLLALAATYFGPCGLTEQGSIQCWGTLNPLEWPFTFDVPDDRDFVSIRGAPHQLCAADVNGLWCDSREEDLSGFESPPPGVPKDYCMNAGYGCGIFEDGVECWGVGGDDPFWGREPNSYVPDDYKRRNRE